ncbi:carbonic anhydrase 5A, mitochondrial isoform X1 [Herpailurus yagouaroundi]|uniref:carbonic anhydrase 5A, mitochondrial isoform X1 n=1 Tax=Herpailurus yagouaroundi TaxID=1608482 RepID=UPI001AD701F3|nr:carbonic anhydrase 5A, mitochondrial isoform X1 [Puma yagouaroundi]
MGTIRCEPEKLTRVTQAKTELPGRIQGSLLGRQAGDGARSRVRNTAAGTTLLSLCPRHRPTQDPSPGDLSTCCGRRGACREAGGSSRLLPWGRRGLREGVLGLTERRGVWLRRPQSRLDGAEMSRSSYLVPQICRRSLQFEFFPPSFLIYLLSPPLVLGHGYWEGRGSRLFAGQVECGSPGLHSVVLRGNESPAWGGPRTQSHPSALSSSPPPPRPAPASPLSSLHSSFFLSSPHTPSLPLRLRLICTGLGQPSHPPPSSSSSSASLHLSRPPAPQAWEQITCPGAEGSSQPTWQVWAPVWSNPPRPLPWVRHGLALGVEGRCLTKRST